MGDSRHGGAHDLNRRYLEAPVSRGRDVRVVMAQDKGIRRRSQGILIALVSVCVSVALCEVGIRIAGVATQPFLEEVQFGWPDPVTLRKKYERDPDLFWVPLNYKASMAKAHRDPPEIVFLGDSCTQFGNYPALVTDKIRQLSGNRSFEGLSLGVGGWSAAQGLRQLERDVVAIHPKVVTVFFGWNDHWKHFGASDQEVAWVGAPVPVLPFNLKIVELAKRAYVTRRSDPQGVRVPLEDFKRTLRDMVTVSRRNGIEIVLLTAPSAHVEGREPKFLTPRWMNNLRDLVPLHQRYAAAVREVAAATGAPLCDLADRFQGFTPQQREEEYMSKDGIHFTKAGNEVLADLIVECLSRNRLLGLSPR